VASQPTGLATKAVLAVEPYNGPVRDAAPPPAGQIEEARHGCDPGIQYARGLVRLEQTQRDQPASWYFRNGNGAQPLLRQGKTKADGPQQQPIAA